MDQKDDDIKRAIDDIFGDDVIEIDTENKNEKTDDIQDELSHTALNIPVVNDEDVSIPEISLTQKTSDVNKDEENSDEEAVSSQTISESKNDHRNKRIFIYFVIVFIIGLVLIYLIINYLNGKERVINCSYSAEDTGYKVTDEYKITYKNSKIIYVEQVYDYTAKTDEYKEQVGYVKDEKLPVIINSNGMDGFTYTYETNDSFFKVMGYLDFTLFDYDKINKIDQNVTPISYFKINSKMTLDDLKASLEDQGYVCSNSD